jgi:HPt (histidine-containing phosphotransfer) domain-containing protein
MENLTLELKNIGVDIDHVIKKLGGNEAVYLSICRKFPDDINYIMFLASMEANDMNLAGMYIHTLKGVASNLGFTKMAALCKTIINDIKNNDLLFTHKSLQELTDEYNKITGLLNK